MERIGMGLGEVKLRNGTDQVFAQEYIETIFFSGK